MAEPSIKLNSPATFIASIKQEPPQSSPHLPPPEPILPPLKVAQIISAINQELHQSTPLLPPPESFPPPLMVVKTEPEEPVQPKQQQEQLLQEEHRPQFLKSIADLASLSKALHAFNCKFDELTKHLDSINQAIDSKFNEQPQKEQQIETHPSLRPTEIESGTVKEGSKTVSPPKPSRCSIQRHCERMFGKGVRKYIVSNLSNVPKLREEIPAALTLAPEPAKLVLACVGQFFHIGKKAYRKNLHTISTRKALVLLLELFLLPRGSFRGGSGIKVAVKVNLEAEKVAIGWRQRLIREGGLDKSCEMDARGLLLFVACFGIPRVFSNVDLGNLLRLCNLRGISEALKASPLLPGIVPAIIDTMVKDGMHSKAVELTFIFGLEDKFSPKMMLTSFLQESTQAFERAKQEAHNNPVVLIKANAKHLKDLKSTVRCLEGRSSDATELLGSWQVEEKIVKLEEEITELDISTGGKKMKSLKRKLDKMGSSSTVKSQEMKRSRFATEGTPLTNTHVNQLQHEQPNIMAKVDGLVPNSFNASNDPVASSAPRETTGSSPKNGIGQTGGTSCFGSIDIGVMPPARSCSGADGEIEADRTRQVMSGNGLPYGWRKGCVPPSASAWFAGLFGASLSIEGFAGVLDNTVRTSADRYRFVDSLP